MESDPASTSTESPQPWLGVYGHRPVRGMLLRALQRDQLHHALLISGPAGVGKKSLVRALAAARLCEVKPLKGCAECPSCLRVLQGNHSDFVLLGPSGASQGISRASMQETLLSLARAPHEGRAHLCCIAPADRMSPEAANALLKTLEEPRPGVMIALVSQRPHAVLSTLRSRSLHLPLRALRRAETLAAISAKAPSLEAQALAPLLELCPGQPGRILALAKDPALQSAQRCMETMLELVDSPQGAAEIFASPQNALWRDWEALVQASELPEAADAAPANPVERVRSGKKKSGKKKAKKKATKKSSKKKASAAQQRQALRTLSELWLSQERGKLRQSEDDSCRRLAWTRSQALMELHRDCERNINPRLLVERALLCMLRHPRPSAPT